MEAQRNDNWSRAEFYQALTACIEAETDVLGPAVQETALRATEPRHLLTRVSFFREELAAEEWNYDDFLLRREILDRNTLLSRLEALQQERLISGPDELPLSSPNPGHSRLGTCRIGVVSAGSGYLDR
jgi:hypothetical protein